MVAFTIPDPAALNVRLTLEQPVEVEDGQGGASITFQPLTKLWARIQYKSQSLSEELDALKAVLTHDITVFWRADFKSGQRLVRQPPVLPAGQVVVANTASAPAIYAIKGLYDPDGSRRFLVLVCEEESP